jgi:hypothetical protein
MKRWIAAVVMMTMVGTMASRARAEERTLVLDPEVVLSVVRTDAPAPDLRLKQADELEAKAQGQKGTATALFVAAGVLGAAAVFGAITTSAPCDQDIDKCPGKIPGTYALLFGTGGSFLSLVAGAAVYGKGVANEREAQRLRKAASEPQVSFSAAPLPGKTGVGGGELGLTMRF